VSDRTPSGRSAPSSFRRQLFDKLLPTPESRYVVIAACVIAILGVLVGGNFYGRYLAALELGGRDNVIEQLRSENLQQKRKIDQQSARLTAIQLKLDAVQRQLESIRPAANTYNIEPNQTLFVGDGRLAIGMIGPPGNEGVTLAIDGKQQMVIAGQVITVAPDPSTSCRVTVQSFDVFKAVIVASCGGTKPQ